MGMSKDRPTFTTEHIKADVDEAVFLGNPLLDNMLSCMIAMGAEIWSTKRRGKVLESLLAEKGVTAEMMEAYVPSEEQITEWNTERDAMVRRMFSYLERDGSKPLRTERDQS